MKHLNRRFEKFDKLNNSLIPATQRAAKIVRIRIVLAEIFQFPNINLSNQCGNVLVVFVAGLSFDDSYLPQLAWLQFDDFEFSDVATSLIEPLYCPGAC